MGGFKMLRLCKVQIAVLALSIAAPAAAQADQQLTIYSSTHFREGSRSFVGATETIKPVFTARSVRVPEGSVWELCIGEGFHGCRRVDHSLESGIFSVRSVRPVATAIRTAPNVVLANKSLRGADSEFFVAPARGSERIGLAGGKLGTMQEAADSFCRSAGWRRAAHARLQSVGDTYYLIDVLCVNEGG
jgi:hypothetical protein